MITSLPGDPTHLIHVIAFSKHSKEFLRQGDYQSFVALVEKYLPRLKSPVSLLLVSAFKQLHATENEVAFQLSSSDLNRLATLFSKTLTVMLEKRLVTADDVSALLSAGAGLSPEFLSQTKAIMAKTQLTKDLPPAPVPSSHVPPRFHL